MRLRRRAAPLLALVAALTATGCATWVPVDGPTPLPFLQLEVDFPADWMAAVWAEGTYLTRHGAELQSMHLRRWPRSAVVKGTGRNLSRDLSPLEIAEISLDSRRLDDTTRGLEIVSNTPIEVDGRPCYRIDYRYRNAINLPMRTVEYGCAVGPWMYRFEYNAAEQHYFYATLVEFEAAVRSARFRVPGAP